MLGAMSGDTAMAAGILDANGDKSAEEVRALQQTEQDKLKDAPWYTKMYGIGKEDYLKKQENNTSNPNQKFPNKMNSESKTLGMVREDGATLTHIGGNDGKPDVWQKSDNPANQLNPTQSDAETARLMRGGSKTESQANGTVSPTGYKWDPISYEAEKKYNSPKVDPVQTGDKKINYLKQVEDQNNELKDMSSKISSQIITPMIATNNIDNSRQTIMPAQPNPYTNGKGFNMWQTKADGKV
jgi:hypothetical protein